MFCHFTYIILPFGACEQVCDRGLVRQHPTYDSQGIERRPVQLAVMLDNGDKTVCDDCNINLYSHGIFCPTPKLEYSETLLDPPKEEFHLPMLLVQQSDVLGLECEVVRQVRKRPLQVRSIVNYPPQLGGILLGMIAGKAYRLIIKDVILAIQQVLAVNHLVVESGLLSDDKVRVEDADFMQPVKVVLSLVKDVERKRLIRNVIHRIHIMDFRFRNVNIGRYLGHYVKQRVDLDSVFGLSDVSPLKQTQSEVNRSGVKGIEPSLQLIFPAEPLALSEIDHSVGELLKDPVIPVGIGVIDVTQLDFASSKTEMVDLSLEGIDEIDGLPKAITAGKLAVHHHKKLVPTRESLHVLVLMVLLHDSIKDSLGQNRHELTEHIFSVIHTCRGLVPAVKFGNQLKSTRTVFAYN